MPLAPFRSAAALVLAGAVLVACGDCAQGPASPAKGLSTPPPGAEVVWLDTGGAAGTEVGAVATAVKGVEGVREFAWAKEGVEARVVRDAGKAPDASLLAAAKGAGAEAAAVVPTATGVFAFEKKLHCAGCVKEVRTTVAALAGVKSVEVGDGKDRLSVVYDPRATKSSDVLSALEKIGKPAKAEPAP
jgi:copper chaperone CopZ